MDINSFEAPPKKLSSLQKRQVEPSLIKATLADYPTIQNMARFYVYDLSRSCGHISSEWACPSDGLYESFDFKNYFEEPGHVAFLIKMQEELAGFVLIHQHGILPETDWSMGEFFILAKFQGHGIGKQIATTIFRQFPGKWEVSVIPENQPAYFFWQKTISNYTVNQFNEATCQVDFDVAQSQRIVFSFTSPILPVTL